MKIAKVAAVYKLKKRARPFHVIKSGYCRLFLYVLAAFHSFSETQVSPSVAYSYIRSWHAYKCHELTNCVVATLICCTDEYCS